VNVQEYISSGIVESYVMGLASPDEQREFEQICAQYPEVLEARIAFETSLEEQAMKNAIIPPASLKEKVVAAAFENPGATIVSIDRTPVVKTNWIKYAAAAAVILLAGSLFWNISLYNQNKQLKTEYTSTVAKLADIEKDLDAITLNPNVKTASMKGLQISPSSTATVFWDTTSKDVFLLVNNLPKPASDRQYQVWALLDGKPIDLGMIDNEMFVDQKRLLLRMKNTGGAQAFAITLEKKGGNPTPQGDMYVMGNP
jgi:anti-sigma-K factor RskA